MFYYAWFYVSSFFVTFATRSIEFWQNAQLDDILSFQGVVLCMSENGLPLPWHREMWLTWTEAPDICPSSILNHSITAHRLAYDFSVSVIHRFCLYLQIKWWFPFAKIQHSRDSGSNVSLTTIYIYLVQGRLWTTTSFLKARRTTTWCLIY